MLTALLETVVETLQHIEGELAKTACERRQISEQLDRLLRSQTETRRQLGLTDLHIPSRHTRRWPLGSQ
ncbi:MAG TPA: hypothetical protein VGF39_14000 [Stellaceae bacterium]